MFSQNAPENPLSGEQDQELFQRLVRRFYYQLTVGCDNPQCSNKLCRKSGLSMVEDTLGKSLINESSAKLLCLQLASRSNSQRFICSYLPEIIPHSPPTTPSTSQSFLNSLLSSKAFSTLFSTDQQISQKPLASSSSIWERTKSFTNLLMLGLNKDFSYSTPSPSVFHSPESSPPLSRSISRSSSYDMLNLPESLNMESFMSLLSELDCSPDSSGQISRLCRILKHVFSKQDALCSSFRSSYETSISKLGIIFGVDLNQVRLFFDILSGQVKSSLDDETRKLLNEAVENGLEVLLVKLEQTSKRWRIAVKHRNGNKNDSPTNFIREKQSSLYRLKSESNLSLASDTSFLDISDIYFRLSQLIILFESPFIQSYYLARKLALVVSKLHISVKKIFVMHMALGYEFDQENFKKIVYTLKRIVCSRYHPNSSNTIPASVSTSTSKEMIEEDGVVACVRLLSFLYNVNEYADLMHKHQTVGDPISYGDFDGSPIRSIIPFWEFYCTVPSKGNVFQNNLHVLEEDEIFLSNLPMKKLYFRFISIHSQAGLLSATFSILNYPFLLDPIAKTRAVRIESLSWMSSEFEDAFVRQGFVGSLKKVIESVGNISLINTIVREDEESVPNITPEVIQQAINQLNTNYSSAVNPYLVLEVTRDTLIDDTLSQLKSKWTDLHKPLKIKFKGEEGVDQGGVQKEFFQLILFKLINPEAGLFVYNEETRLSWINSFSQESASVFLLFGVILGLALYNGVMVDLNFPLVFYKKLLYDMDKSKHETSFSLDDISQLQPQTHKGLELLLRWDSNNGSVEEIFCRSFEISYDNNGIVKTYPLIENGENIEITKNNREEFVNLYVEHYVCESIRKYFQPLREGFWRVVGGPQYLKFSLGNEIGRKDEHKSRKIPCAVELFRPEELQILLVGLSISSKNSLYSAKAFEEFRRMVQYEDYREDMEIIKNFWDIILSEFSDGQRRQLLWFVTASDRIPLGGLKTVTFVIQRNGGDTNRLPTALTCFGRLLLPQYATKEKLKIALSTAIQESQGFGLL